MNTIKLMTYQRLYSALARLRLSRVLWILLAGTLLAGLAWLWLARPQSASDFSPTANVEVLQGPVIAAMQSPAFVYANAWQLSAIGADPGEPAEPWREPAGTLHFTYTGAELSLLLAAGDYWGYLYVTVDGQPANLLPVLAGNRNSQGERAGYRTLYAPEQQGATGPTPQWIRVHRANDAASTHTVTIEVWRSWQQIPLRGVAVDALPTPPLPRWPGIALLLIAGCFFVIAIQRTAPTFARRMPRGIDWVRSFLLLNGGVRAAQYLAPVALLVLGAGVYWRSTALTLAALALLAWCGLQRPALWVAALLLGLPFYYTYTLPILPTRAISLIDLGLLGGLAILLVRWLLTGVPKTYASALKPSTADRSAWWMTLLLALIISWAFLAASEATHVDLALREWRTVFLSGGLFAFLLLRTLHTSTQRVPDQHLIIGAWMVGALLVAGVGIWQAVSNEMVINAEGVQRVRGFYGSPNNLALYLERALAPVLALALFARQGWWRWLAAGSALMLGGALLLTFSKGALLLGLPAMLVVLWIGGIALLRQRGQ